MSSATEATAATAATAATEATSLPSVSAASASNSEPVSPTAIEITAASTAPWTSATVSATLSATPYITTQTQTENEQTQHPFIIPTAILASTALLILLAILFKKLHTNRRRKKNLNSVSQIPDTRPRRNSSLFGGSSMASNPSLRNTDLESILAYTSRTASQKQTPTVLPTHRPITSTIPRGNDNALQRQSAATQSYETDNVSYDIAFTSSETSKRASIETVLTISEVSDYAVYFDYTTKKQ
ncbi:hypothetical protein HDU81_008019 [Chytriomyces hyalinus]|nr:hypothetical protein HDU81_008019 [Chytriomyces hyalinus]